MQSKVIKIYDFYRQVLWSEEAGNWDEQILECAKNSKLEFSNLISLFEKETDTYYKLQLSDILARLKYKKIESFLLEISSAGNIEEKYEATFSLIYLEYKNSYKQIQKLLQAVKNDKEKKFTKNCIISDLKTIHNKTSEKILESLT